MRQTSALAMLFAAILTASAAALDKWTVDAALSMKQIGDVAISPSGKYVLYSLSWSIPAENRRCSDLFVVTSDGSRTWQLTHNDDRELAPEWAPGRERVSYISGKQVWTVTPGGDPVQVTRAERGAISYAWSRTGALAYVSPEPKTPERDAHEKEWGVVYSFEEQWPQRSSLWMLENGKTRQVAVGQPAAPEFASDGVGFAYLDGKRLIVNGAPVADGVHFFAWAPGGKTLAYIMGKDRPEPYENQFRRPVFRGTGSIWLWDGRTRRLTADEFPALARLVWSRDGKRMAFLARSPGAGADRTALEKLHILSLDGEFRTAAPGFDFYRGGANMTWSADNREVWFLNGERMGVNMFAADAASGVLRNVTAAQDCLGQVSYTPDFTLAAYVHENANTKPDIHVTALARWDGKRITDINPEVRRLAGGQGEIIRYPSEGRQIEALLIKPPDFDLKKKYPLILIVHGGPTWYKKNNWTPEWEQHPVQAYASEGYCLVFPNVRGSADYGAEFRQANYRDLGGGDARDAMAAVDHLIAQGFIDPDRLGVAGWSYGGYLTPAIIAMTDRFKAAQFGAGIPSMEAMYGRLSTVEWIVHDNYGPRPWEDARMQIQSSPLYSAWKIKTPTLIEHGEDDPRCPVDGSVLFYKALKYYGVPAVLEIYPKEGHGIVGPLLRRRCERRNLEWFNKWLKGDRTTSFEKLFPSPR